MPQIHPTAVIDPRAELDDSVRIGPFCVIEGPAKLAKGVFLHGHNWLHGPIELGEDCKLYPYASAGLPPQHTGIDPDAPHPGVKLGARVTLREHVTIHSAMPDKPNPTTLGNDCFLMSSAHVGHDCQIGNKVIIASNSPLGGHCIVGDNSFISGNVCVHQYCHIGKGTMVSGGSVVSMDVPPYCIVSERNRLNGLNLIGMRRAGISSKDITYARKAYRQVFRNSLPKDEMLRQLDELAQESEIVALMAQFVRESTRGISPGDGRPSPSAMRWMRDLIAGKANVQALDAEAV